jgi:hypothetical protein
MKPPLLYPLDDPPVPWKPDGHAAGWPVTESLQRFGNATEVATTPPPSRTKAIAAEDLMARA